MSDLLEKIPEPAAILIIGSPTSNKNKLLYEIVNYTLKKKQPTVFITTNHKLIKPNPPKANHQ